MNRNGISTSWWLEKKKEQFGDDLDHLNRKRARLETDGDSESLFCDSSLCQKTHCESQEGVKKANDKGIITD